MDEQVAVGDQFAGRGNRGNIHAIINKFPSWAAGKQHECVSVLAGKGIGGDLNALCAWLKDRSTGTTMWRGKGKRMTETDAQREQQLLRAFAESEIIAAGKIFSGAYADGPQPYWFRDFSPEQRDRAAAAGAAMPGGRYPIYNRKDAVNARRAIGRTPPGGRAAVMAHIRRRERALGIAHADSHHAATQMGAMPEGMGEPMLRSPGSAQYMHQPVTDLGTDNTGAHASTEPDDYSDPTPSDVHVPGPVGLSPGNYGGHYAPPRAGLLQPLRRVLSNVVGGDRTVRVAAEPVWHAGAQQYCQFCNFDADPDLSLEQNSPYGQVGMHPHVYDDMYDDPEGVDDDYGAGLQIGSGYNPLDPDNNGDFDIPDGFGAVVFYPARFSERFWNPPTQPVQNVADLCGHAQDTPGATRLFVELSEYAWKKFVDNGNKLPYLPKPGIYAHPKYGTVVITRERNQRFAENMNNHVYQ